VFEFRCLYGRREGVEIVFILFILFIVFVVREYEFVRCEFDLGHLAHAHVLLRMVSVSYAIACERA